jgi:hypothetical protein
MRGGGVCWQDCFPGQRHTASMYASLTAGLWPLLGLDHCLLWQAVCHEHTNSWWPVVQARSVRLECEINSGCAIIAVASWCAHIIPLSVLVVSFPYLWLLAGLRQQHCGTAVVPFTAAPVACVLHCTRLSMECAPVRFARPLLYKHCGNSTPAQRCHRTVLSVLAAALSVLA